METCAESPYDRGFLSSKHGVTCCKTQSLRALFDRGDYLETERHKNRPSWPRSLVRSMKYYYVDNKCATRLKRRVRIHTSAVSLFNHLLAFLFSLIGWRRIIFVYSRVTSLRERAHQIILEVLENKTEPELLLK